MDTEYAEVKLIYTVKICTQGRGIGIHRERVQGTYDDPDHDINDISYILVSDVKYKY